MRYLYLNEHDKRRIRALHRLLSSDEGRGLITLNDINELIRNIGTSVPGKLCTSKKTHLIKEHYQWSDEAKELLLKDLPPGKKLWGQHGLLHREHIVPLNLIWSKLPSGPDATLAEFETIFLQYLELVVITKEESHHLDKALVKGGLGLRKDMPADWDGVDKYARLRKANIRVSPYTDDHIQNSPNLL